MARHVYQTPQTRDDLVEIAQYIARNDLRAAMRFLDAAERTFEQLAGSPELGARSEFLSPFLAGVRRWRIRKFEHYLIFYRPVSGGIEVIRVLHGARDIDAVFEVDD